MGWFSNVSKHISKKSGSSSNSSGNKTSTTITNKNGSQSSGYIQGGQTYHSDGSRIGAGSSVTDTSGRQWTMGSDGKGVLTGYAQGALPSDPNSPASGKYNKEYGYSGGGGIAGGNNLMDAYENQQKEILRQQQEALRQRIEQGVNNLETQKGTVTAGFDDAARQAYIMRMQNQKALPEQMAAVGQTGGATESSNLAIGAAYQNNLADINNNRVQAINGIDSAINNVRTDGNIEAANLAANNAQSGLEMYMQMMQNKMNAEQQAAADSKNDFINTLGGTPDFQAQINRIQRAVASGDNSEAWKIPYYQQGRAEKISGQESASAAAAQQQFDNNLQLGKLGISQQNANTTRQRLAISQQNASRAGNSASWNQAYKLWDAGRNDSWILNILGL